LTNPAENLASMKVKMSGIQFKIADCVGSGDAGASLICTHWVSPMISGHAQIVRNPPSRGSDSGSYGISPNRLKTLVGSGADKSRIHPKNGARRISMVTNSTL